jgi:DNA helicase-2/ATP-dependent DNA helicase PcrA
VEEDLFERVGEMDEDLVTEAKEFIRATRHQDEMVKEKGYAEGERVRHPFFGEGTIEAIDEARNQYKIFFDELKAPRPISRNFKRLEKVE